MQALSIEKKQFQALPEFAQRQVYDFFLFVKNKYSYSVSDKPCHKEHEFDFIDYYSNNPVILKKNTKFLTREEANER